jgi:hypothetical protein
MLYIRFPLSLYPGGTEKLIILFTLAREIPKWPAAAPSLMPPRRARRTFKYKSTTIISREAL